MPLPTATVIIPTFDHGQTLVYAVASALAQTVPVEVFIVGDGVPEAGKAMIHQLLKQDDRLRFFDHPKHVSRGEPYRHVAIGQARGRIICYLCDRDLWFPDHVEKLDGLLQQADFAHAFPMHLLPVSIAKFFPNDLSQPIFRQMMLTVWSRVPLSCAAHTVGFYKQLACGWDTTPPGHPTDAHFFNKFLMHDECRLVSGYEPTVLTFPSPERKGWTTQQRCEELAVWQACIQSPEKRAALVMSIMQWALKDRDMELGKLYTQLLGPTGSVAG
jgi:glycosyltransferase involved in cell wall biosynthesis